MTLGEYIIQYRAKTTMSQRAFAERCGLSNGYISLLEAGVNPKTGKPIVPSIPKLKAIADGMNLTLDQLIRECDDMPVLLTSQDDSDESDDGEHTFTTLAHKLQRLDPEKQKKVEQVIMAMFPEDFT